MNIFCSICSLINCNSCCEICGKICAAIPAYLCTAHHGWCNCEEPRETKYEIVEMDEPPTLNMNRKKELKF
jgi:hypothetical protein